MLEVKDISKKYGKTVALSHVNFTLEPGLYGLIGPNGAGKSTLMNIIVDNLKADEGLVLWNGTEVSGAAHVGNNSGFRRVLGYAPQQQGLYDSFTGRRFLAYMAALKEIPKSSVAEEVLKVAGHVNLTLKLDERIGKYSGGMKQRILIAQAMMGNPEIMILDEPTAGLDPRERVRLRGILAGLAEKMIILVSTHVVSDVESVAKGILIIKQGHIICNDSPEKLVAQFGDGRSLESAYMELFGEGQTDVYSL